MPHTEQAEVDRLWERYARGNQESVRNDLILAYLPLVRFVARRVAMGLPQTIEEADLVSYGVFGLVDAIEKFDPTRGIKFPTYATSRIRGAVLDELRAIDWVPRSVRAKVRRVRGARSTLEGSLQRSPTESELANELGIGEVELQRISSQISFTGLIPLDEIISDGGGEGRLTLAETLADRGQAPGAAFDDEETRQILLRAIERLPDRDRKVLTLYYDEGRTLAEIGRALGVTESRICQLRAKALLRLRSRMTPEAEDDRGSRVA